MATITQVIEAFERLYCAMHDKRFVKTLKFTEKNEKDLLPLVRCYLLGYFDQVDPEQKIRIEDYQSGSIDFIIDNVAVEFAVRNRNQSRTCLSRNQNEKEIKKLMRYANPSLLVLFDFVPTDDETVKEILTKYRELPSFSDEQIYPFSVVYFYLNQDNEFSQQKIQVRVN